jgi:AcrR family transcriptional regulator
MTDRFGHLVFRIIPGQVQEMAELQEDPPAALEPLSPERRARIMAGAAEIFTRDGYEGASMAHIAAAARVSKGTLYNYFAGKEALFGAFVRDNCAQLLQEMFGDMRDDAPVGEELTRIGGTMMKTMLSPKALTTFRVAVMEAAKFPELARTFVESGPELLVRNMADWISRRVAAGDMIVEDPHFAAEQFFALTQTRLVLRARMDAGFRASPGEIEHVLSGAIRVFLAAYGKTAL